eukprot:scaffold27432_cov112-Isochrysis_galbana.AAC.1
MFYLYRRVTCRTHARTRPPTTTHTRTHLPNSLTRTDGRYGLHLHSSNPSNKWPNLQCCECGRAAIVGTIQQVPSFAVLRVRTCSYCWHHPTSALICSAASANVQLFVGSDKRHRRLTVLRSCCLPQTMVHSVLRKRAVFVPV